MQEYNKKYFFICGCARSGTTALWRLVSAHPEAAVGIERYIGLVKPKKFTLSRDLFEESRFFDLHEGDTHFQSLFEGGIGRYYQELKSRYNNCKIWGDKIPRLFNYYNELSTVFGDVRFLFIFRNIFDVAQSFNSRAQGDKWPQNRDFKAAVTEWNKSLAETLKYINAGGNVLCLEYEELFFGGIKPEVIENFLGLHSTDNVHRKLNELIESSKELDQKRDDKLTTPQKQYIMHNADFKAYKEILRLSVLQRGGLNH
jgi:hypothetical protein